MKKICLLLLLLISMPGQSQFAQLTPQAKVSLLTVDSGNELYSLYGHTGLRIQDPGQGIDEVYNYGYFDFSTPNFYMKFVKGDLQYFAAKDRYSDFINNYVYEQRSVYEQVLNLTQQQAQNIYNDLNAVLASDQRFYTYKFIDRNCTTMVADVINRHIDTPISTDISVSHMSYRKILYNYQEPRFFENLGINIMFGSKTDQQFDHNFLPMHLLEGIEKTRIGGRPLSSGTVELNKSTLTPEIPFWDSQTTYVILCMLLISFSKKRMVQISYFVIASLLGLFIISAGLFSLHKELVLNINILLFNPLFLVLAVMIARNKLRATLFTAYICMGLVIVYYILLLDKPHAGMFFPMFIMTAVLLFHVIMARRKVVRGGSTADL